MKKKIGRFLKIFAFCALLAVAVAGVSRLVERKESREKMQPFLSRAGEYDVLFMGDSVMSTGVFPMELWEKYGIAGYNIASLVVEDRIEGRELPFVLADNESLWRVVPRRVAFDYIVSDYHEEMRALMRQGKEVDPLFYPADRAFGRRLRMVKNLLGHFKKFKQYYERKA